MASPKKAVNYIVFLFILIITGCMNSKDPNGGSVVMNSKDPNGVATISTDQDFFEFTLEIKSEGKNKVTVTRKIQYNGDENIIVTHAFPLISVIGYSKYSEDSYHTFSAVEMQTELKSKEALVYGAPLVFEISDEKTVISGLANFTHNNILYSLSLQYEY